MTATDPYRAVKLTSGDPRSIPGKVIVVAGLLTVALLHGVTSASSPAQPAITATQTCSQTHYAVGVPCFVAP
jgi:hypothetical protein